MLSLADPRFAIVALIALICSSIGYAGDHAQVQNDAACGAPQFPHFDRALLLENTSETSANISVGDLRGNGNLDIVLQKGRHWPLVSRVLLNDGHGRFPIARALGETPYRSYSAVLVDIN